jgi:hypothetical protein
VSEDKPEDRGVVGDDFERWLDDLSGRGGLGLASGESPGRVAQGGWRTETSSWPGDQAARGARGETEIDRGPGG